MTKLNLLGAQRVKALTEILERKYKDAIKDLEKGRMTSEEAVREYASREGLSEMLEEAESLVSELRMIAPRIYDDLAVRIRMDVEYLGYVYSDESKASTHIRALRDGDYEEEKTKLVRELEERKSQLWLVETLEQAQAIVNAPIGGESDD